MLKVKVFCLMTNDERPVKAKGVLLAQPRPLRVGHNNRPGVLLPRQPDEEQHPGAQLQLDVQADTAREKEVKAKREAKTPPDSQFQHLLPSENRYSFRHDEF